LLSFSADAAISPSKAELHQWLDEALEAAEEVPADERRDVAYGLSMDTGLREERIRKALLRIALRPSSFGWINLVWVMEVPPEGVSWGPEQVKEHRDAATEFIEGAYRARAGVNDATALAWQHGLAEMLFTRGEFEEALRLQREVVARDTQPYSLVLLAMMEKVAGNNGPYDKIMADCPESKNREEKGLGKAYCRVVVTSVARRMLVTLEPARVPAAVHEMLAGRAMPWEERMHGYELVRNATPAAAEADLRAVVATSDAPSWAKDDAIYMLARQSPLDAKRTLPLIDCWLSRRGVTFPAVTAETWKALAAMPFDRRRVTFVPMGSDDCYRHHDPAAARPPSTGCLLATLHLRIRTAMNGRDYAEARQGIEWMTTVVLGTGWGHDSLGWMLRSFRELRPDDATRQILQYYATLPIPYPIEGEIADAVRSQSAPPAEPWKSIGRTTPAGQCP
jgi:hypothetical protein